MLINRPSVLIVDDNQSILEVLKEVLTDSKKFKMVVCANNGSDALTKISNQEFGLVILDLNMPKLGGLEFLKSVYGKGILNKTHVLVASGTLDGENIKDIVAMGIKNFIVKPYSNENLLTKIDEILKKKLEN